MQTEPQIIHVPGGEDMVVLTRADFDELVARAADADEDAADAALFDERTAELASGAVSVLPAEVTAQILKGVSLPKALRKWRGLTQAQMAEVTGIGQSYLSEIENQSKPGSADAWAKIAVALDVPRDWLTKGE